MSDEAGGRSYSEDEFALILRQAADPSWSDPAIRSTSTGYSLDEIKSIAAEAGLDPERVERAARSIPMARPSSLWQRIVGGPSHIRHRLSFSGPLSEDRGAKLLAGVRARTEERGDSEMEPGGFYWSSVDAWNTLVVTAHPEGSDTEISMSLDGRGFTWSTGILGVAAATFATFVTVGLGEGGLFGLPVGLAILGTAWAGTLGLVRALWARASRRRQRTLAELVGTIERAMASEEPAPDSESDAGT